MSSLTHKFFIIATFLCYPSSSDAFTTPSHIGISSNFQHSNVNALKSPLLNTNTSADNKNNSIIQKKKSNFPIYAEKKKKLDEDVKSRLITESIAPWRTLRLFLYVSLGSGAALGGFITAAGVAATLSGARPDVDLNTDYLNLAIDFGAVIAFVIFGKLDIDKGNELNTKVEERIQKTKQNKVIRKGMKGREQTLGKLNLDIRVSQDENVPTQKAEVAAIQAGGKQHMIVVIGPKPVIRDALLGANILKMEFAMRDVLIVPYELNKKKDEEKLKPDGQKGFGSNSRPTWELQPYVAQPTGEGWDEYIQAELNDAIQQNGEKVKEEGVAIVVANTGEIIRRGVGKVPWRNMVEELEKVEKDDELLDMGFLTG